MKEESIESRIEKLERELERLKKDKKKADKKERKKAGKKRKTRKVTQQKKVIKERKTVKELQHGKKKILPGKGKNRWDSFERIVGERWLVWVGAVVFAIGFAIFLKYAFEQGWVNEIARCILGFLVGVLLLWFAYILFRKKFVALAQGISGLGLIVLYLTIFTAYHFYGLFEVRWAFLLFFIVTIGGMTIAINYNAFVTALLSILGAFATPLLLADPTKTVYYEPFLFSYLFIINVGVLYVASLKRWRAISIISFFLTIFYFTGWYVSEYTGSDFPLAAGFTAAYFILFSFMSTPQSIIWKKKSHWEDLFLVIVNPLIFFIITYTMLKDRDLGKFIPLVPLGMAIYHFVLARVLKRISMEDRLLYFGLMGTAVGLLTLPVPMLVKSYWITVAWGAEAIILIIVGSLINRKPLRIGGLVVFLLVTVRFFTIDTVIQLKGDEVNLLFLNLQYLAVFLSSLTFGFAAYLMGTLKNVSSVERKYRFPLWIMFMLSLFWITNVNIIDYFLRYSGIAGRMMWPYTTILWSVFFCWLIIQGLLTGNKPLRITGLCLMVATALKVLYLDTPLLYRYYEYGYAFIFNVKFLSLVLFFLAIVAAALVYKKKDRGKIEENGPVFLWTTFAGMLFLCLNFEIFSYFGCMENGEIRMLRLIISSMLWTAFACWFLLTGIFRKEIVPRIVGFTLIGMTSFKFLFIDTTVLFGYTYGVPFLLNLKFLSLVLLLGVIAVGAIFYRKYIVGEEKKGNITVSALWTTFLVLLFLGLNIEIISCFGQAAVQWVRLQSLIFTSIFWALFSILLIIFGLRKRIAGLRITGIVLAVFTFLKIIIEDTTILYSYPYGFPFLLNLKFASALVLMLVLAYTAVSYANRKKEVMKFENSMIPYLWAMLLIVLFIEMHSQATLSLYHVWDIEHQKATFAMSFLWVLYGFGLLLVGIVKRILPLRISALSLFGITLCKVFFVDLRFTGKFYKMFVLMGIGTIFLIAAYFYRRYRESLQNKDDNQ
jgi:uncharacterized membrane protein